MKNNACALFALILSIALLAAPARAQLVTQVYASGLSHPVACIQDPTNPSVQFVLQQAGQIKVIQNGAIVGTFLDLTGQLTSGGERGLLGLAFAPDYASSGHVFINYTDLNGNTQIARFTRSAGNPFLADPSSRYNIINIGQPFSNHNGGTVRFGPDGMLYIGMGDGGDEYDPGNRAQTPSTLLGKMLRIDPSADAFPSDPNRNYSIPVNNPFPPGNGLGALPEIWSFGLRNPWKFSFDDPSRGGTGAMLIGEVGQDSYEEVDYEPAGRGGRNYGWRQREGFHDTGLGGMPAFLPYTDPIAEYSHAVGHAIAGGYVYRGTLLGSFYRGRYFYGDEVDDQLWSLHVNVDPNTGEGSASDIRNHTAEVGGTSALGSVSSVDIDANGELLICDYSGGRIIRLLSTPVVVNPSSYSLFRGILLSGSLSSLFSSDNQYLSVRPGFVLSTAEAPVQIVVNGTAPVASPLRLRFIVEAHVSIGNLQQQTELYNFSAARYDAVDTRAATLSDSTVTVTASNPALYVNPSDHAIRARISYKATGPILSYPWTVNVDRAVWDVIQ